MVISSSNQEGFRWVHSLESIFEYSICPFVLGSTISFIGNSNLNQEKAQIAQLWHNDLVMGRDFLCGEIKNFIS